MSSFALSVQSSHLRKKMHSHQPLRTEREWDAASIGVVMSIATIAGILAYWSEDNAEGEC